MHNSKKYIKTLIFIFVIVAIVTPVYAVNVISTTSTNSSSNSIKTNTLNSTTNSTNSTTSVNSTNTTTTTTKKTTVKSSNANLSNLGITPYDFSGFKESKTEYDVSVPNNITEVEVYATKKDSKATLTGTGKIKLQEGNNVAKIVVTAEDGTTKTYTINIKKLKVGEKETGNNTKQSNLYLEKLEISGINLEPNFDKNTYQYKANFEGSQKELEIKTEANQANATVKIVGNENLINGQNIITIIVTDAKETEVATYQIYANKNLVEQEELNKHIDEAEKNYQTKNLIIKMLIGAIVLCLFILLILIHKKRNSEEYKSEKARKKLAKVTKKIADENIKESNVKEKKKQRNKKTGRHSKK